MASCGHALDKSGDANSRGVVPLIIMHDFGFRVKIPANWRVEHPPNATMKAGGVAYTSPGGNVFFISFGELSGIAKEVKTLDDHQSASIAKLQAQGMVTSKVTTKELQVCGHRAILSNLEGSIRTGGTANLWSVHLWCDVTNRYFGLNSNFGNKGEFADTPTIFTSLAQSLVCHTNAPSTLEGSKWRWANLGFNTITKLWFLSLYDFSGLLETYQAGDIIIKGGSGIQYQWPDGTRPIWHVRERIFPDDAAKIGYDDSGNLEIEARMTAASPEQGIPEDYDSISYAYSISTSRGFIEFCDGEGRIIKRFDNRWIEVENLSRRTAGKFPNIRLTAKRADIEKIVITEHSVIIQGNA